MGLVTPTSLKDLDSGAQKEWALEEPEKVQVTGYYPRKSAIRKTYKHGMDNKEVYQIEYNDMVFRLGDDVYKTNGDLRNNMSEDKWCPEINCEDMENGEADDISREFCSTCGTFGVRAFGKRAWGVKQAKMHTSCECMKYCKESGGAEGYKFFQARGALIKNKKGRCTCLNKIVTSKSAFDIRFTSAVF